MKEIEPSNFHSNFCREIFSRLILRKSTMNKCGHRAPGRIAFICKMLIYRSNILSKLFDLIYWIRLYLIRNKMKRWIIHMLLLIATNFNQGLMRLNPGNYLSTTELDVDRLLLHGDSLTELFYREKRPSQGLFPGCAALFSASIIVEHIGYWRFIRSGRKWLKEQPEEFVFSPCALDK